MRRLLALVLTFLAGVAGPAWAELCTFYQAYPGPNNTEYTYHTTVLGACEASVGKTWNGRTITAGTLYSPSTCRFDWSGGYSTWVPPSSQRECVTECNPADPPQTKAVMMGFGRAAARSDGALWQTTDGRSFMAPASGYSSMMTQSPPDFMCDGTCELVADGAGGDWWADKEPNANGNYGIYKEQGYKYTGGKCTARDEKLDPATLGPPCAGALGEVNGKAVCAEKVPPSGFDYNPKMTTSGAGSTPAQATSTTGEGLTVGPNGEVPGKGGDQKGSPDTGGTGGGSGTSGGITGTGTQTNSDGTTSTFTIEADLKTCGMPGNPACKIDESGTPDGRNAIKDDGLKTGWDSLDQQLQNIQGSTDKDTSWMFPSWLSSSQCQPWDLGEFVIWQYRVPVRIDACHMQAPSVAIMSFLWIVGTFFAVLAMMSSVMLGPSRVG